MLCVVFMEWDSSVMWIGVLLCFYFLCAQQAKKQFSRKKARDQFQSPFTGIVCLLQWNHGTDSCLCYTGAIDCCHSGPSPTSTTGLWLSETLQVLKIPKSTSGWPHPCTHTLLHHPHWELPGQLSSPFTVHILAHWLTHLLVPLVMDGVRGTVRQGQKYGLPLITLALLPAITFSFPSSIPPVHLPPALRAE